MEKDALTKEKRRQSLVVKEEVDKMIQDSQVFHSEQRLDQYGLFRANTKRRLSNYRMKSKERLRRQSRSTIRYRKTEKERLE